MARMKFLCDADRCIECNACVTACKNEHEVPWGINRRRVVTINDGKPGERSVSMACMHCTDAPCQAVCPTEAIVFGNINDPTSRVARLKADARNQGRPINDGEIKTACQAACPGEAIVFGDINDPASRVAKLKAEPRNYGLLAELNTRPRTTYLSHVKNPNPAMPGGDAPENAGG